MTRKTMFGTFMLVVVFALTACGGGGTYTAGEYKQIKAPSWFYAAQENPDNQLQAAATAQSSRLGTALDKARLRAKRDIATTVASNIKEQRKTSVNENQQYGGEGSQTVEHSGMIRSLTEADLRGASTTEKAVVKTDGGYRAFVLVELDEKQLDNLDKTKAGF